VRKCGVVDGNSTLALIAMVKKYAHEPDNPAKSAKARGENLRVHFKNTLETANAIRGMSLRRAQAFLKNVVDHKEAVPFRVFRGGIGRTAQAKVWGTTQARWPKKSATYILDLLQNVEANAEHKGLDLDILHVQNILVNRAPKQRRRTYRAHGRINPYMSSPSHIQLVVTEIEKNIPRAASTPADEEKRKKTVSKKKLARERTRIASQPL